MKAVVLQENLQLALNAIQKAIPSRPQLPVLAAILLEATESEIIISATDMYFGVQAKVAATVETPGTVAIPGKEFREIIGSLSAGELKLDYIEQTLTIQSKRTKSKLQCMDSSEYPAFPEKEGTEQALSKEALETISQYVLFSASTDVARPLLTGVLFSSGEDTQEIVATDGFRLSVLQQPITTTTENYNIPAKTLSEVQRVLQQQKQSQAVLSVSHEQKQVFIELGDVVMYSRLLEGEYPPYQKIMPTSFTTEVVMSAAELLEQVKRATIFSRDTSSIVQFEITSETVSLKAASSTLGEFSGDLSDVQISGDGGTIAFKTKYLQDFLQTVKDEQIWFGMTDSLKPALFKAETVPGLQYIVMPFRVTT